MSASLYAELIAILSAFGWAGDAVFVRFGLRQSNIFAAMLVSYTVSITCVWSYLIATTPLDFLKSPAMIYYLISGSLQPLFARALYYEGINRIGVARAGPLRGSEPLFAVAVAVAFLGEKPGLSVYSGTLLIFASLWLISGKPEGQKNWHWLDAALPIGAAMISTVSQTLRKQALKIVPDPLVATAVVTTVSLTLLVSFVCATRRTAHLRMNARSLIFFACAAGLAVMAQISNFVALGKGDMSVIIPLLNTTPLFNVLLSVVFLRDLERVDLRIISGAILMVGGVVLITSR